ncbi:putative DNA-3-methyladenine glycosidase I [Methanobrevibacter arboriphilus JCM 13429 = DSM 1125]|uniref:Putative DNA-3-methyladenine glycosidase I n=1 Tax=Methanobrevibacter arboriphilus JCM 13429 = DSM 1125 TaxID=1300164 RepID=A0A1V6N0W2_METAZ|nr:DNA-3-methyladenine glycosylase I [Methanobrevibacter arboriphilus]OQD58370.1 putative DNA-3-methyladenine glycosidase I [Methanobrevibacter arboriphilus JCM 13429 = DSM 1125]
MDWTLFISNIMMRNGEKKLQIIIKFLNSYLRTFLPERKPINNHWKTLSEVPSSILLSETIAKDMKKHGFKFFGPVICYAFLQAIGYVNNHLEECPFKYSD